MSDATNPSGRMARFWRDQEIETLEQELLEAVCFATDDMTVGELRETLSAPWQRLVNLRGERDNE